MTNLAVKKAEDEILNNDSYLFDLQFFASSFDSQFRELLLLQNNVIKMLYDTVKKIKKLKK